MASDIFAKIGDIKGESLDDKHKDEIEVLSWSWGVTNAGATPTGGGACGGEGELPRSLVHPQDRQGLPGADEGCATGQHLKEATITRRKAGKGKQEFLVIKMNDVLITAVTDSDEQRRGNLETVTLAFAKVDLEYRPQKADGSLDAGIHFKYDIKANKEG